MKQKYYEIFDASTPRTTMDNGGHFAVRSPHLVSAPARNFFTFEVQRLLVVRAWVERPVRSESKLSYFAIGDAM